MSTTLRWGLAVLVLALAGSCAAFAYAVLTSPTTAGALSPH